MGAGDDGRAVGEESPFQDFIQVFWVCAGLGSKHFRLRGTARGRTRSTMEPEVPAAASDVQDNHTADEGDGAQKKAESIVKVGHVDSFV